MNDQAPKKDMSLDDAKILAQMATRFYQGGAFAQSEWFFRQALSGFRLHMNGQCEMGLVLLYFAESLFFQGKPACMESYVEALPILEKAGCTKEVECIRQRLYRVMDVETQGQLAN